MKSPQKTSLKIAGFAVVAMAAMASSLGYAQRGGGFPQGPGGFGPGPGGMGGPGGEEIKLVKQFDKDGDKILNSAERKAARAYMESQGMSGGRGGPGGRGGRGGPGGMNAGPAEPGRAISPKDVPSFATAGVFDAGVLRTYFLTFDDADWQDQLTVFKNTDVDVPATLVVDGRTYKDVGAHFHGSSSFFMVPEGRKHSIALKLDLLHEDQQIGGQHRLLLLNSAEDATFLRSVLFTTIARDFLPAPRANHARLAINGESWGIYVNIQHYDKDFVRDWFKATDGARWKVPGNPGARGGLEYLGTDAAAYKPHYEIKTADDPKSWAAFINLCRVLNETPTDTLAAALAPIFDVDQALRFLAVDNALVNDDGYWTRSSDYSIYLDAKGKFHVFPWDSNETFAGDEIGGSGRGGPGGRGPGGPGFGPPGGDPFGGGPPDQMFGRRGRGGPGGPGGRGGPGGGRGSATLDPLIGLNDSTKPLRSKLLAVPEFRTAYLGYVKQIATKWMDWNTIGPIATKAQALIADDVKADTKKLDTFESFQSAFDSLKAFLAERRAYLLKYGG